MGILQQIASPVQSASGAAPSGPYWLPCEGEPYIPSDLDLAWDTGFTIGREDGKFEYPREWPPEKAYRYELGRLAGRRAREAAAARELGEAMGYAEAAPEPPGGYDAREAGAFRAGYAAGLERFEQEREYEAWLDTLAASRSEELAGPAPSDRDLYRAGCAS